MADLSDVTLHYVETSEEAAAFVEWCRRPRRAVAVDTETTGLARDARIRLIQFGDDVDAWTLRWDRWKGPALEALDLMKRARQRLVFHNSPFDVTKIEDQSSLDGDPYRFDWGLVDDTMLMSRLSEPVGGHDLKGLCARLVDPRARAMQSVLGDAMAANGWTWETVPYTYEGYSVYAGLDTVLTVRLLDVLEKRQFSRDLYHTEMAVAEACCLMSAAGMEVDLDYCDEQARLLADEVHALQATARREFRVTQLGSNQIMADKLNTLGLYWDDRTTKGAVKMDAEVLGRLGLEEGPGGALAHLILEYRQRSKLLNTYFANFIRAALDDGAVHPDINSLEAVTGRMTVTEPAMQTLPRGPRARRAFVSRPGARFVLADYSQIEIRVMAHYAQDPLLFEAIETGDVHTASAQMIFGGEQVTPLQRQLAKSSTLAIIFGAGDEKFSHTAGVSLEVGSAFLREYHSRFTLVRPFMDRVQGLGRRRLREEGKAYVVTQDGRKLGMRKHDAFYTLVNYLCQGTAADIFKRAIERLHNADMTQYMRLPVHDEVIFEVPNEVDPDEFKREIVKLMEDDSFRVPMIVETSGPYRSWADKYGAPPA